MELTSHKMNKKNSSVLAIAAAAIMLAGGLIAVVGVSDVDASRGGNIRDNTVTTGAGGAGGAGAEGGPANGGRGGDGGEGGDGGCRQGGDCEASPGSRGGEVSPGSRGGETGDNEDVGNGEIDASGGSGGDGGNGGDSGDIEIG